MDTCNICEVQYVIADHDGHRNICKKCYLKEYYKQNKDEIRKKNQQYHEENSERIKEQRREYRENNREKIAEQNKVYRENNSEKIKARKKQYSIENREKNKKKRQTEMGKYKMKKDNWTRNNIIEPEETWKIFYFNIYLKTEKCEVCNITFDNTSKKINNRRSLDHDHHSGYIRFICCHKCNISTIRKYDILRDRLIIEFHRYCHRTDISDKFKKCLNLP